MKKFLIIVCFSSGVFQGKAQLADGSTAPDFTLNDINGNSINLYGYLDAGITVYLDIFAAHCPTCWAYHNTYALKDLYNNHGPAGTLTQDIMVIAIEHDPANGMNELTGVSGSTAGDWVTGTPYPIINPEGTDRSNFISAYNVTFYPMIYAICPDRKITWIGTQDETTLYNHVGTCAVSGMNDVDVETLQVYFSNTDNLIHVKVSKTGVCSLTIFDSNGRVVLQQKSVEGPVSFTQFGQGIYLYQVTDNTGNLKTGKFFK
ncbi:MAG TPA: T9SS type A sorting domain-containing protein [Flavobacteriales bacterium]|nr:T9SS type A sorting domain-containing protein [Flavobacteriales bacterium]